MAAHRLLGGGNLLPVHWGTFNLALHPWDAPAEELVALAPRAGARLLMPRLGAPLEPAHEHRIEAWWRGVDSPGTRTAAPVVEMPRDIPWPLD